ncbi:glycosyltransferase family 25 protein [Mucilaginibacter litoreus]|uniref:Glycosyltransferase family 25 protein n=1 Tax=Mucilaginibacter litoreus TaxID=1048221 RepID=A0ABW3AVY4_9SPHI
MSHNDFEVAYYINLPHRVDRKLRFERMAQFLPVKKVIRFEAVDGTGMDSAWPGTPGAWGCRESHIRLLEIAKKEGYQKFMIIEDDAIINKSFPKKFDKFLKLVGDDWDMLYLHTQAHWLKPIKINKNVIQLQSTLGTVGIAYNARNLDIILNKLKNDYRWVDSCMGDLHTVLKVYAPTKYLVKHANGFSDNTLTINRTDRHQVEILYYKLKSTLKGVAKKILKKLHLLR